jgi:glycosyltransferase involved in cell wall biosynthesis
MIAPPWIPVPPPAYGGIEAVVALLSDELVARGDEVTLFAAAGSHSAARVRMPLEAAHPDRIGAALYEGDFVGAVFDEIAHGDFDVVHDHSAFTALPMAPRLGVPLVHTIHAAFNEETRPFYRRHGAKARLAAISHHQRAHAPAGVEIASVVHNPIRVGDWPYVPVKEDFLLWVGRMDPVKGAHRAIEVARRAGMPLVLAGPVQPGQEEYFRTRVEPLIDGEQVVYAGEVGGTRREQLFASARAFLMPISWPEPFGMVMVEALACGTPVLAFPEGAAREIVEHGENGFLVAGEEEMVGAVERLGEIDPARCRASAAERFDVAIAADGYEDAYEAAISGRAVPRRVALMR